MTDNKATRTIIMRTRPALHEDEDEAESEYFDLGATLASRPCYVEPNPESGSVKLHKFNSL